MTPLLHRPRLGRGGGATLIVTYLTLLVLLPIVALGTSAFDGGVSGFWHAVSQPEGLAALKLTLACSLVVAAVNVVAGSCIAWVLVRDQFRGKALVDRVIDLPFALPTVVAGLTLLALYGPGSPVGVDIAGTPAGIVVALAFVTLPFCVRTVQPVLAALDVQAEEAAATLGASPALVARRVVIPALLPAMLAAAGLAFARGVAEFGSVVLVSGSVPFKTEVASSWIYSLSQSQSFGSAAAVSIVLIVVSLAVLGLTGLFRRRLHARLAS